MELQGEGNSNTASYKRFVGAKIGCVIVIVMLDGDGMMFVLSIAGGREEGSFRGIELWIMSHARHRFGHG